MTGLRALLTTETRETASGSYHVAAEDGERSVCGTVNGDSPFAAQTYRVVTEERAEELGLDLCGRCATIAEPSGSDR